MLAGVVARVPPGAVSLKASVVITGALRPFQNWPREFTVSLQWAEFPPDDVKIRYAGAGTSRVVYTSCSPHSPYAFKFAAGSYLRDDNALEFDVSEIPAWLIPKVFGLCSIELQSVQASVLVVEKMSRSLFDVAL